MANGLAIGLLEIGAVFQAVQRERVRLFLRQHAVPDVRHQASEQPASQGGDADPVAQPQQALRNVMIIVARRRRNGRIDEHQADNARIPAGVKHRMVGSRAQADQHHAFHPMMRLERIQHLGDVGQTGVHGRQVIDPLAGIADTREIEAQHGMARRGQLTRHEHVHAVVSDTMHDPGIQNHDGRRIRDGRVGRERTPTSDCRLPNATTCSVNASLMPTTRRCAGWPVPAPPRSRSPLRARGSAHR